MPKVKNENRQKEKSQQIALEFQKIRYANSEKEICLTSKSCPFVNQNFFFISLKKCCNRNECIHKLLSAKYCR